MESETTLLSRRAWLRYWTSTVRVPAPGARSQMWEVSYGIQPVQAPPALRILISMIVCWPSLAERSRRTRLRPVELSPPLMLTEPVGGVESE